MSKVTKLLFSVSEQGNPIAKVWVDDMDTSKTSEAITLGIRSQVAYVFFMGTGSEIQTKKVKGWTNVEVPKAFETLFENYNILEGDAKIYGVMFNNAFNNAFNSLEFLKLGEVTEVSLEELKEGSARFLDEKFKLEEIVYEHMSNSKSVPKLHKNMIKVLDKEDAKQSEIKDGQEILSRYTAQLNREYIQKNNLRIEKES